MSEVHPDIRVESRELVWVRSATAPDHWYKVNPLTDECECLGWRHRQDCRHLKLVAAQDNLFADYEEELSDDLLQAIPQIFTSRFFNYDLLNSGVVIPVRISPFRPLMELPYELAAVVPELQPERETFGDFTQMSTGLWKRWRGTALRGSARSWLAYRRIMMVRP